MPELSAAERQVIEAFRGGAILGIDALVTATGRPIAEVSSSLMMLELKKLVVKKADGEIDFVVADRRAASPVTYKGEVPDLFREGQGVVANGAYDASGVFVATQLLAKHDEKYMPPQLAAALKKEGEWRGDGATPSYDQGDAR